MTNELKHVILRYARTLNKKVTPKLDFNIIYSFSKMLFMFKTRLFKRLGFKIEQPFLDLFQNKVLYFNRQYFSETYFIQSYISKTTQICIILDQVQKVLSQP